MKNLRVSFDTEAGLVEAVRGVSFDLGRERLGIVGESGSGKTMTGRAVLRLIRPPGRIEADEMTFDGQDLLHASDSQMRALRGRRIAMVMQDPKYSLNPVMTVGQQLTEGLRMRDRLGRAEAEARAIKALEAVQIRDPARVMKAWPHELSGGMGQRVMIAMMLIPEPKVIIADEPTSALDVSVQAQVLNLMRDLQDEFGLTYLLISHNLAVIRHMCDDIGVMQRGKLVEVGDAQVVLDDPQHAYTKDLMAAIPDIAHVH